MGKKHCFLVITSRFQVSDVLHVFGYPEHDVAISEKCLSPCAYVRDGNFMASVTQELIQRVS